MVRVAGGPGGSPVARNETLYGCAQGLTTERRAQSPLGAGDTLQVRRGVRVGDRPATTHNGPCDRNSLERVPGRILDSDRDRLRQPATDHRTLSITRLADQGRRHALERGMNEGDR